MATSKNSSVQFQISIFIEGATPYALGPYIISRSYTSTNAKTIVGFFLSTSILVAVYFSEKMRLRINLHLRVDGARLYLSLDPSSYPSTDHVQSFAAQRARSWLANDNVAVFAAGLDKRCHVVVMPPVDERGEEECVCHVYCVETKHTGVGMSVREVATQMESVFQLTDVREEGIIPWITCQDGEGCSYCDRAFEDCPTTAGE